MDFRLSTPAPPIGITPIFSPPPVTTAQPEPPLDRTVGPTHIGDVLPTVLAAILARCDRREARDRRRGLCE